MMSSVEVGDKPQYSMLRDRRSPHEIHAIGILMWPPGSNSKAKARFAHICQTLNSAHNNSAFTL